MSINFPDAYKLASMPHAGGLMTDGSSQTWVLRVCLTLHRSRAWSGVSSVAACMVRRFKCRRVHGQAFQVSPREFWRLTNGACIRHGRKPSARLCDHPGRLRSEEQHQFAHVWVMGLEHEFVYNLLRHIVVGGLLPAGS